MHAALAETADMLSMTWLVTAAAFVLLMQGGFLSSKPGWCAPRTRSASRRRTSNAARRRNCRSEQERERISTRANATSEGILLLREDRIVDANEAAKRLLCADLLTLAQTSLGELLVGCDGGRLAAHIAEGSAAPVELRLSPDLGSIPVELRVRPIDTRQGPTILISLCDLSARRQAEEQICFLALHDGLTGLANRPSFNRRLEDMLLELAGTDRMGALLTLDLDRFKDINDLYGHPAGDAVIVATAERTAFAGRKGWRPVAAETSSQFFFPGSMSPPRPAISPFGSCRPCASRSKWVRG